METINCKHCNQPLAQFVGVPGDDDQWYHIDNKEKTMSKDTDGTEWMTVRYTIDISVMAEDADEAFYHANLIFEEKTLGDFYAEIVGED